MVGLRRTTRVVCLYSSFVVALANVDEMRRWLGRSTNWIGVSRLRLPTLDIEHRRRSGAWLAYEAKNLMLEESPDDAMIQLAAAEALLKWIRQSTNGNFLRVESGVVKTGDSPSSRKIWKRHASEALRLLRLAEVHALECPSVDDAKYFFLVAEANTYCSSAKGVLRAAVQADALTFKRHVGPLTTQYPKYQGGVGHIFMGAFHLAAPWPVYNLSKAQAHFDEALKIDPLSRRNHYCQGLAALETGNIADACSSFRKCIRCRPRSPEEEDVGDFFMTQSRKALSLLESGAGPGRKPSTSCVQHKLEQFMERLAPGKLKHR
ncbi:unnamed protein product [Choristocarpus tenellus]